MGRAQRITFEDFLDSPLPSPTLEPEVHFDPSTGEAASDRIINFDAYRQRMIRASRKDPAVFARYAFGWRNEDFHNEIQDFLTDHRRALVFAPNETGKSSQVSFLRALWELGGNTNLRIALGGATGDGPEDSLGLIQTAIMTNPRVATGGPGIAVFPWLKPETRRGRMQSWLKSEIIVEREDLENKDPSIRATGMGGNQEGWRVDLWILDDILNRLNTLTKDQRAATIKWLTSTVIPRSTLLSRLWCIGTPWYDDDALAWLSKNPEWAFLRFDITDRIWPKATMVKGKVVGWPDWRWQQRRREIGSLEFNRSMRCRPISDSARVFRMEDFDACVELSGRDSFYGSAEEFEDEGWLVGSGMDLAVKDRKKNAETALATLGLSPEGLYHLIDLRAGREGISYVLRQMLEIQRLFEPFVQVVENNQAQDYVIQFVEKSDEILAIVGVRDAHSLLNYVRVEPITTDGGKKADVDYGITAMAADLEQRKFRFPDTEEVRRLRDEFDAYKIGEHPGDRLMAFWFIWRRLRRESMRTKLRAMTVGAKKRVRTVQPTPPRRRLLVR